MLALARPAFTPFEPLRRLALAIMLLGCTTFLLGVAPPAKAADAPAAAGPTLRLQESASREVAKDTATAVFVIEREGSQPGALQSEVNGVIAAALADLKSDKALIVSSGRYSTYPRHSRDGRIQSWRVRAELLAESTDIDAVSRATATLSGRMNLGSIGFSLSLAAREKVEAELIAEAANRFYQTAREAARALGFSEVELIEASYNKNQSGPPMPMARAVMSAAAETPSVPMQPGQATVTVSFGGALRLKR